jgi:hypothetical protein
MTRLIAVAALVVALTGCTFASVRPEVAGTPPPTPPRVLVIGDVSFEDALWEPYRLHFARGVNDWLKRNGGFESVLMERPATLPADGVVLISRITELDKGSPALRLLVGMGAGKAKIKGQFELQDSSGKVLTRFSSSEAYLGGAGIGGAGFIDMDDLTRRLAETVAEAARDFARGKPTKVQ